MRRCWNREEVQESQGPRVPRSRGPKVPGSKGPRYLKFTFKYELDSKEGPSCLSFKIAQIDQGLQCSTMVSSSSMVSRFSIITKFSMISMSLMLSKSNGLV